MEIIEIDVTAFMQIVEMAVQAAFYTVAFIGGAIIGFAIVMSFLGEDK